MKIDWKQKLSSRKLWASAAGFVTGLMLYFGAAPQSAESVGSLIMMGASVVGYLLAEGLVDCERVRRDASDGQVP